MLLTLKKCMSVCVYVVLINRAKVTIKYWGYNDFITLKICITLSSLKALQA